LRSRGSPISQFYIAIVVCFCHCCSTTVTPGSYGVDRVSVVARLAICYIAPLDGGTTYAIRATSTLNTPIHRRRIVVVATAVATGKCSSSAWVVGCGCTIGVLVVVVACEVDVMIIDVDGGG
jgi:hypothetical protein